MGDYGAGNRKFRGVHSSAPTGRSDREVHIRSPTSDSGTNKGSTSAPAGRQALGDLTNRPNSYSSYVRPDGQMPRGRHSSRRAESYRRNNQEWATYIDGRGNHQQSTADPTQLGVHSTSNSTKKLSFEETQALMSTKSRRQTWNADESEIEEWVKAHEEESVQHLMEQERDRVQRVIDEGYPEAPVHGWMSEYREEGVQRVLFGNVNGMCTWKTKNRKTSMITDLVNTYNIDMVGIVECGINWGYYKASQSLAALFKLDREVRSVQASNVTEATNRCSQHGGSGMMVVGETIQHAKRSGKDPRDLGRWTWYLLEGEPNHRTRVITGYQPVKAKPKGLETVYQQHLHYIQHEGLHTTPWELFPSDLLLQLKQWR